MTHYTADSATVKEAERPFPGRVIRRVIQRGLLWDTVVVSAFTLLAKAFGAAKAAAMARTFGSAHNLDHYLLAFLIPSFIADILCGALVPAAVPEFVERAYLHDHAGMQSFYESILRAALKLTLFVSAICAIAAAGLAMAPATPALHLVGVLLLVMIPIIPLAAATNVWRAVLNARRNFALPAFTAVLAPAFVIIVILVSGRTGGVWTLALGTMLASTVEVVILAAAIRRAGFTLLRVQAKPRPVSAPTRREYGYLVATAAVGGGTMFLGQFMAASLGSGSVSILNYGTRVAGVLLALGPAALSVAILPRFSQLVAERDWISLKRSLIQVLAISMAAGTAIAIGLSYFSTTIVRLTLQRGAFTASDTSAVAAVQAYSLLQLPFLIGITTLTRTLAALKANQILLPVFGATLILNIALSYILMQRFQVSGIALASCIGQGILFFVLIGMVFRVLFRMQFRASNGTFLTGTCG